MRHVTVELNLDCFKTMFLVLVDSNYERTDDRIWKLDEAKAAMRALVECDLSIHLAVIRSVSETGLGRISKRNGTDFCATVCARSSPRRRR